METTSRAEPHDATGDDSGSGGKVRGVPGARPVLAGYLAADFPWYGLDDAFTGPRWLTQVGMAADGSVEHGATGHGQEPTLRAELGHEDQRFTAVVTVAGRPVRRSPDGHGVLEATSPASAAWLAGSGLLACTWPAQMERALRQDWLEQQTSIAWELADDLGSSGWSELSLPVDGVPTSFHYRESEYGWVLAGAAPHGVHIGAYGRGMSAYGLGFAVIKDIESYSVRG
ncbi:hypothetical protein [Streptomyces sp. NBRC 109706]|uniref:hypothetical protein n=1 Tax=Streptomyces sp. NBRC 109706 TaxID=1550035 RepID=UPI0007820C55|nr:hypothetical protein [Streptomyces sp. NBRC 109706]